MLELKMLEVIMKVNNPQKEKKDQEQPQGKSMQTNITSLTSPSV